MYYIGWNIGKTVPFRNSIGLMFSDDEGETFEKNFTKLINSLFLATKSVSLFISITDILLLSSFIRAKPSEAVLLIFFEAFTIPFF